MKRLSQTKRAKALRKMRRDETPRAKAKRLAHRRHLLAVWRAKYGANGLPVLFKKSMF